MRHLVIAAHPSMRSFNHAVVEAYTSELIERGHRVECRDLYAAGFNPILSARDLAAVARGKLAKDIKVEQAAIRRADVLTFISPLWWSGFPAMLKGYILIAFSARDLPALLRAETICQDFQAKRAPSSPRRGRRRRNSKAVEPCGRYGRSMTKG